MKKLFSGRFHLHKVPMAVFVVLLIALVFTGTVFATTYTLWSGTATVIVTEPITILWGSTQETCTHELSELPTAYGLCPGGCWRTWFKISSAASNDLTVRVTVNSSDPAVTVNFTGNLAGSGVVVNDAAATYVEMLICADNSTEADSYIVAIEFMRG